MATQNNTSFTVERREHVLVQPLHPTPTHDILSFSTIDNIPSLEFICQTISVFCANDSGGAARNHLENGILANDMHYHRDSKVSDPATVIKEALSKALVYYYPLAGKLKRQEDGKLRLTCTGEGVPFIAAKASCTLAYLCYLDGIDVHDNQKFLFKKEMTGNDSGTHPLMMQVTEFACGGFTVGMGLSHSICDGFGAAQFFSAVAELASGKVELRVKPVWDRARLVVSAPEGPMQIFSNKSSLATSPHSLTTDLVLGSFDVDVESIKRLKVGLMNQSSSDNNFTTVELLGAYVWRSKCKALELNSDGKTEFSMAIGLRNLLDPPLPEGYYGNAFIVTHAELLVSELRDGPLSNAVKLLKESKTRVNEEYVWSCLRFLEKANQENEKIPARGASVVLTDWRHMQLSNVDFGWKEAVNVIPVPWNIFDFVDNCIFLPPCSLDPKMKGGVRLLVCFPRAAMPKFKKEMELLKLRQEWI